jgi:hypothetical protein
MTGTESTIMDVLASFDRLTKVMITPVRRAQRARLLAELAHRRGDADGARAAEGDAVELLRSVGAPSLLAGALLDAVRRRGDADALAEVREIYAELGATRWLERLDVQVGAPA